MSRLQFQVDPVTVILGAAIVGGVVWFAVVGFRGLARTATKAVVDVGTGAVEGTVVGLGEAVGIPETDKSDCARALAEGRWWDASFKCPAGTFLGGVFGAGESQDAQTVQDARTVPGAGLMP